MKNQNEPNHRLLLRNLILSRHPDFTLPLPIGNGKEMDIKINQISFIKSDEILSQVNFQNGMTKGLTCTIKECEKKLINFAFLRVHRSYLINGSCIQDMTWEREGEMQMMCGALIPMPRRRKEVVIDFLNMMNLTHLL